MSEALRLAEALERMRGPHLGDGINPGVNAYQLAAELRRLHAENEALRAQVERLRLMQPVIIGPTGQSNMLTAGEIAVIDAARKEST